MSLPFSYSVTRNVLRLINSHAFSTHDSLAQLKQLNNLSSLLQQFSKSITWVMSIHAQIITHHFYTDQYLITKLIKAYSDLGNLRNARQVFDQIPHPQVFLCNAMINGYLKNEIFGEALSLFDAMCCSSFEIDSCTCTFALRACTGLLDYESGMGIIGTCAENGMIRDRFLGCSAIGFLVKFDRVDDARWVFDRIRNRDVVCWNSMMRGYLQVCCFTETIDVFLEMRVCGIIPTPVTMVTLIQACGGTKEIELGKSVHGCVIALGMVENIMVFTSLIDMYNKMGGTQSAFTIFDKMPAKNLVTWNVMISGFVQNSLVHESFSIFSGLMDSSCGVDSTTIATLLQGCSQIADIKSGKILHGCVYRRGFEVNLIISTALVDLYCKCSALNQAIYLFNQIKDKNVVTWTALLVGLAQNGQAQDALKLFRQMQQDGIFANEVTLVSLLHSCAHLGSLKKGKSVHTQFLRHGFASDVVNMTALTDMYAKCGNMNYVERIFQHGFVDKDVILWNSMITSYGIHGHGNKAIDTYNRMIENRVKPDESTFVSLLTACSHSGLVDKGIKLLNIMELDHSLRPTEKHYACIVDLLSRAGRFKEAEAFIKKMPFDPSALVLEALLYGCRKHKNMELGVKTADRLLQLNATNPGIYIVLSNIYAEANKWDEVDYVRGLMRKQGMKKVPGFSSIEIGNEIHTFFASNDSHPKWGEIYRFLETLRLEVEARGYAPDTSCVLRKVDKKMKVKLLWSHSERLAMAFGLLNTPPGSLIRVTKNLRVCIDCHNLTKFISMVVKREIIVRDANRFHHFKDGICSCGDYW